MNDFQEFKREYINENMPRLYGGELDVMVTWTCGGQTRYNAMTELDVWRVCKHEEQMRGAVKSVYGWSK